MKKLDAYKYKFLTIMLGISISLASMGCGNKNNNDIVEEIDIICDDVQINEEELDNDTKKLMLKKYNEGIIATTGRLELFCMPGYINYNYHNYRDLSDELDDDVYLFINRYVRDNNVRYFSLNDDVINTLDFNQIDLSGITSLDLWLNACDKEVNLAPFSDNYYEKLSIGIDNNVNFENILVFLSKLDLNNTELLFQLEKDMSSEQIQRFIDLLGCFESFDNLTILSYESFVGIDISNVKATNLKIGIFKSNKDIDYEMNLNEKVYNFQLSFMPDLGIVLDEVNLHNITINSDRDDLLVIFAVTSQVALNSKVSKINVTDESKFELPNDCYFLSMKLDTESVNYDRFESLKNVRILANSKDDEVAMLYYDSSKYSSEEAKEDYNKRIKLDSPIEEEMVLNLRN